jgi:hypothetical protein
MGEGEVERFAESDEGFHTESRQDAAPTGTQQK